VKKLIIPLLFCFLPLAAGPQAPPPNMDVFDGCGMDGTATSASLKGLNRLKNRYAVPQPNQISNSISLTTILAPGNDKTRWSSA